jgi:hypothetical protein
MIKTHSKPDGIVRIGRKAGAAGILLIARRLDHDRILERAWNDPSQKL